MTSLALSVALALGVEPVGTAHAAGGFHEFSSAIFSVAPANFTGARMYRADTPVYGVPSGGCSTPIAGTPVYQTEWLRMNGGGFLELGTGHQCLDNYVYWFWGYELPNQEWRLLGYQDGVAEGQQHWFEISEISSPQGPYYHYIIGSTTKAQIYWNVMGYENTALLESYASGASILYTMTYLADQRSFGAWSNWTSGETKNVGTPMCGKFTSTTSYRAGEPSNVC